MKQKITFTQRAAASLRRAEEAEGNTSLVREQLHLAEVQLQLAEKFDVQTINDAIAVNQLYKAISALRAVS